MSQPQLRAALAVRRTESMYVVLATLETPGGRADTHSRTLRATQSQGQTVLFLQSWT